MIDYFALALSHGLLLLALWRLLLRPDLNAEQTGAERANEERGGERRADVSRSPRQRA